jgi:hypothetical protein
MSSHGFYVRHAKGIQLDNIETKAGKEDQRPAFALHRVADFDVPVCAGAPDVQWAKVERNTL